VVLNRLIMMVDGLGSKTMEIDITVSANSEDIFKNREEKDLSIFGIDWDSDLNISITNPYSFTNDNIKVIDTI